MRCRGAKFFSSTCAASTAVSSSSSSAKSGTCFKTSGLQAMATSSTQTRFAFSVLFQAFESSTTSNNRAHSKPDECRNFNEHSARVGKTLWTETRRAGTISLFDHSDFHVLSRGVLRQQRGHSLRPAVESFRAAKGNDNRQHLHRCVRHHRSFRIARCAPVRTNRVGKQRQPFQIQIVFADSLIRFAGAPRPKNNFTDNML